MAKKKDGIKIRLDIKDRFEITKLLPKESNIITLIIMEDITKKIAFSQAERNKFEPMPNGGVRWEKDKIVDVYFTKAEIEFLRAQITEIDKNKKATPEMLPLILKIRACNV